LNAADLHDIAVLEISTLIPTPTPTPTSTSRPGPTASPASTKQLTSCQQTILKAATKFFTTRMASLARCEVSKVKGKLGAQTDCRAETKTAAKLGKAVDKLRKDIGKKCGGDDKTCGGNLNHESGGAVLGWPAVCPTLTFGSCGGAITPNACNGIAECIECLTNAASDESIDVSFPGSPSTDKGLIKCQQTLGAAAVAFARAKASALQKCWLARLKAKPKHTNDCIPPATGDGKVIGAIAKAAAKRDKAICKACGGADKACGGSDDFKPGDIGFPATCRNVKPPGATACASGQITVLQGAVTCVGCVNEFVVDCLDLVAVPEFDAIPSDCMTK
jgi:hypothetical protein